MWYLGLASTYNRRTDIISRRILKIEIGLFPNLNSGLGKGWVQRGDDLHPRCLPSSSWPEFEHGEAVLIHHELDYLPWDAQSSKLYNLEHREPRAIHQKNPSPIEGVFSLQDRIECHLGNSRRVRVKLKNHKELQLSNDVQRRRLAGPPPA